MVLLEKLLVYNGILIETIGISVMVSIGLLLFFFKQGSVRCGCHIETICESSSSDCNQMTETYILKDKTVNLACSMYFERPVDLK